MEYFNHSRSSSSIISQASNGVLGACFLLGVPANIAVLVLLRRHLKKDNFTLHLMLNLAASDILRLIILPLWMYNLSFAWALGRGPCKLVFLLMFTSTYSSVLTVTLMSIQRYVVVLHRSQWTKLGSKGEKLLLVCLWSLALILSSPAAVKAEIVEEQDWVCQRVTDEETLGILLGETLLGFVLPFSIMAMFYFCLHKKVKQTPLFSNPRLARLVIAILVSFFILWLPFHVMNLVRFLGLVLRPSNPLVAQRINHFWYSGHGVAKTLTMLNSCVNPLLYTWTFRRRSQTPDESKGNVMTSLTTGKD